MKRYGWIKSIRGSKSITFVSATDGYDSDFQVTIHKDTPIKGGDLKVGASFICDGDPSTTPKGLYEFLAKGFAIVGQSDDEFPIQPKPHSKDFLRTIPELRGRTKEFQAIWRIRHRVTQIIHKFFDDESFFQYYTPIITQADCEGAGQAFAAKSDWLDEKLTVSAQLHGEVGMMSLGQIYTFAPCFRAEKSATKKHLAEFWMIEPEMAFYDLDETIAFTEKFLKSVLFGTTLQSVKDLNVLGIEYCDELVMGSWIRKKYKEIVEEFGITYGDDISSEMEKKIVKKYGPTFITHYPSDLKPFYMKKVDGEALCFDLIFPEVGELVGGSVREDDHDTLKFEMEKAGVDMEKMQWYLNTRKWGSVPHSGFGLGFERLLLYITKQEKIHDVIPFPISY